MTGKHRKVSCNNCNGTGKVRVKVPKSDPPEWIDLDCPVCDGKGHF